MASLRKKKLVSTSKTYSNFKWDGTRCQKEWASHVGMQHLSKSSMETSRNSVKVYAISIIKLWFGIKSDCGGYHCILPDYRMSFHFRKRGTSYCLTRSQCGPYNFLNDDFKRSLTYPPIEKLIGKQKVIKNAEHHDRYQTFNHYDCEKANLVKKREPTTKAMQQDIERPHLTSKCRRSLSHIVMLPLYRWKVTNGNVTVALATDYTNITKPHTFDDVICHDRKLANIYTCFEMSSVSDEPEEFITLEELLAHQGRCSAYVLCLWDREL